MSNTQKYIICSHVIRKDGTVLDGICGIKQNLVMYISNIEEINKRKECIIIAEGKDAAKSYIRYISEKKKYEFTKRAKELRCNPSEFYFYPVKINSKKFAKYNFKEISKCFSPIKDEDSKTYPENYYNRIYCVESPNNKKMPD